MLKDIGLARQHLDSYNTFLEHGLQEVINAFKGFEIDTPRGRYEVRFGRIRIGRPRVIEHDGTYVEDVRPSLCRLRGLTYAAPLLLEFHIYRDGHHVDTREIYIGDLPVMLKSKACVLSKMSPDQLIEVGEDPDDPGGYFIINGSERVIVSLEDLASNTILTGIEKSGGVTKYVAKILSVKGILRTQVTVTLRKGEVSVEIPWVPTLLPFIVLMRALGFEKDEEIALAVSRNEKILEAIAPSFDKAPKIDTVEELSLIHISEPTRPY